MNKVDWIVAEHLRQTREPTYTRLVDGVPCMTVTEHKHILAAARVAALEEAAKVCDVTPGQPFRPSIEAAWAIRALINTNLTTGEMK